MEGEPRAPGTLETDDEVVWSRVWERPRWRPPSLGAALAWRPARTTFAVLLVVFFTPGVVLGVMRWRDTLALAQNHATNSFGQLFVPDWARLLYWAAVVLAAAGMAVVLGGVLLLRWLRIGGAVVLIGLVADVTGQVLELVAYLRSGRAPAADTGETIAAVASRLALLVLAVLLFIPRRPAPATTDTDALAPSAP